MPLHGTVLPPLQPSSLLSWHRASSTLYATLKVVLVRFMLSLRRQWGAVWVDYTERRCDAATRKIDVHVFLFFL